MKTLLLLPLSALLTCLVPFSTLHNSSYQQHTSEYTSFWWQQEAEVMKCKMEAPTTGWVELNIVNPNGTSSTLKATIKSGRIEWAAAATAQVSNGQGVETPYYTAIEFELPAAQLQPGASLSMAYGATDDFNSAPVKQVQF